MDQFEQAKKRYEDLLPSMTAIKTKEFRKDLARFSCNCVDTLTEISKESVVCRQRRQVTEKYKNLIKSYIESVDNLEKYIMLAHLSGG